MIIDDATGRVLEQWTGFQVAVDDGARLPRRVRPARERALHLAAAVRAVPAAVLQLPPAVLAAAPRPARAAVVLGLARVLQPRAHLRVGAAGLSAAAVPARAHARAAAPRAAHGDAAPAGPAAPARPGPLAGARRRLPARLSHRAERHRLERDRRRLRGRDRRAADRRRTGPCTAPIPSDNEHGDTYGPVNYEAYVPFEQIFGWSGTWDDLPAAHAAAIFFDLLAVALLFLLGRRMRGPTLGIALAYAWVVLPVHAVRAGEQRQRHARRRARARGAAGGELPLERRPAPRAARSRRSPG